MRHIVIMAGGKGTRLWPLSTNESPKQFQAFLGEKTLIQDTYDRAAQITDPANIWISTSDRYLDIVKEQLPDIRDDRIILEPSAKNTAPAIGLVALKIHETNPKAIITTLASDHHIGKSAKMVEAVGHAFEFVEENPEYFNCIGAKPTRADIGLGYIKIGKQITNGLQPIFNVQNFVEKPNEETAERYYQGWEYLWNTAYFTFRTDHFLAVFKKYLPSTYKKLEQYLKTGDRAVYEKIDSQPIEPPIIEKLDKISVIPADMDWDDIGNWSSLHNLAAIGKNKNFIKGEHLGLDTKNCLVLSGGKKIFTIGLEDLVIVDTDKALMICHKNQVQLVKNMVEKIKEEKLDYLL